jgi:5-hydroxyisourate hydrolase-like protein (transthyretin family)
MRLRLLLLLIFVPCAHLIAQQGQYTISGTVISAATGQPLDRADVSLLAANSEQGQSVAEATTNADGRFAFTHLAAAKYSLRADRQGYLAAAYDEHDGFSTSIVTGEGLVSDGLFFRLAPHSVIGGTITDDSGDPVQQARVSLFRQNTRSGMNNIVHAGTAMTDDTGAYEFARLEPGNYFLAVSATPWYATHSQPMSDAQGNPTPDTSHSSLDVAYPMTFYADVTDEDAATPIPVKAGDRIQINFSLHLVPAVHLSFKTSQMPGQPWSMPQLRQEIFGTIDSMPAQSYSSGIVRPGGIMTVETSGVAPGHYEISLSAPRGANSTEGSSRATSIDITGDASLDTTQMEMLADITGKVAMADGGKLPDRVNIALQAADGQSPSNGRGDGRIGADGTFTMHGVPPGSYEIHVTSNSGKLISIFQMTASGATVEGHTLKVGSQPATLAATLVEGSATISGFAKNNGKPASGVMVLLVPNHQKFNRELFRRDQSNSDGSFELRQVVPGSYTLVAIEDGWALDWARPEAIAHYLTKGQAVTIPSGSRSVSLKDPIEIQSK